jgi:molybdopterin molybdotransferase
VSEAPQRLIGVAEARKRVLVSFRPLEPECVSLAEALGRPLARTLVSDIDIAPFDNSAMDGFAVRAKDTAGAAETTPSLLRVIEEVPAGTVPTRRVGPNEATRIMTGAPMPEGADAVVKIEETLPAPAGGDVAVRVPATPGQHVRLRGADVRCGDEVLTVGEVFSPAAAGLAASTGHVNVWVCRRPRVAILATGDELVEPGHIPGSGQIRDSNSYALAAQVSSAGGVPLRYDIVRDTEDSVRSALELAATQADVIVSSGGVSVGDYDVVRDVLQREGRLDFWSIAMRPGSPVTFGEYAGIPFFGLPGNPTSGFVGFELFVRPSLRLMQGFQSLQRPTVTARITHEVRKRPGRTHFLRATLTPTPGDSEVAYEVSAAGSQSSALLSVLHRANCLVVVPQDASVLAPGTLVECIRLDIEEGTP